MKMQKKIIMVNVLSLQGIFLRTNFHNFQTISVRTLPSISRYCCNDVNFDRQKRLSSIVMDEF